MKALIALLLAALGAGAAIAEPLRLVTEDYPPYAFREAGIIKGTSIDQLDLMMKATGIGHTLEMMPWARAIALAEHEPMHCAVTTAHNAERDPLFKWVEPLLSGRTLLIRKTGADIAPKTIEEARRYLVGTTRGEFTVHLLAEKGFERIDLASDFNLSLKKLMLGRIDMLPIAEEHYAKLRKEGIAVEQVLVISEQKYALACNKSVPDDMIRRLQASLDTLIADGSQVRIFEKYGIAFGAH